MSKTNSILVVNAGSSSIKMTLYSQNDPSLVQCEIIVERIGLGDTTQILKKNGVEESRQTLSARNYSEAIAAAIKALQQNAPAEILAIGHRIVHGGDRFNESVIVDAEVLNELKKLKELDPDHMPAALDLLKALQDAFTAARHVACFDTTFYRDLPPVAQMMALPRKYHSMGLRRYGFHGLSYTYLLQELKQARGESVAKGRIIFAHLGSGVSLTATKNGRPVETTMGMSPASGVMMSTRSGDIDPGVPLRLHSLTGMDLKEINRMLNQESGLLGVSETTADMYELINNRNTDEQAAETVELFCYQVKKAIGSLAAVLGGIDTIVVAGGMGENAPVIRERIFGDLEFLGVEFDQDKNTQDEATITAPNSRVPVYVMHTDESRVIVSEVIKTLKLEAKV